VRRNVVVPVLEPMRRRDARIVEGQDFRGDERAVVAVGDGVDAEHGNEDGDGVDSHKLLLNVKMESQYRFNVDFQSSTNRPVSRTTSDPDHIYRPITLSTFLKRRLCKRRIFS